jgi:hypothetical protein
VTRGKKPKPTAPGSSRRLARRVLAALLTLAAVGGLVWGVSRLGDEARRGIGPRDRYAVRFADIECDPPPGLDRAGFLAEVRYVSNFPESFQSLDPDLAPKLSAAFAAHPWVAGVDAVSADADGTVRVKVRHRTPALAVNLAGGGVRVVDGACVLLPREADRAGLPELVTPVPPPASAAGQVWADDTVRRAVQLVAAHRPRKLEKLATGWRLTMPDGKTLAIEK